MLPIFFTFASLLSLTHDVLSYPAPELRPRSQSPDYDGSDYEQSAGQVNEVPCSQGFVSDDRGNCVRKEEIPTVTIDYGDYFGTPTTSSNTISSTSTTTSSTTTPSGSPKSTVLDKLVVSFVVVLFFVRWWGKMKIESMHLPLVQLLLKLCKVGILCLTEAIEQTNFSSTIVQLSRNNFCFFFFLSDESWIAWNKSCWPV